MLLRRSADVTEVVRDGGSWSLFNAMDGDHTDIMENLLRAMADINMSRCGCTPLHLTAKRAHVGAMEQLLQARADVNRRDSSGNTALALVRQNLNGLEGGISAIPSEIARFSEAQEVLLKASRYTADEELGDTGHP